MRTIISIAWLTTVLAGAGCTDEDPIEPVFARATMGVTDETGTANAGPSVAGRATADGAFSGVLSATGRIEVSGDGEDWVELGSASPFRVGLQSVGEETMVQAGVQIPVGTYSRVRLTLTDGRAELDGGVTLGGTSFTDGLAIAVGGDDGTVVIEKEVHPFEVDADSHARIRIDLNSELWVNERSASTQVASDLEVREAAVASRSVTRTD